MNISSEDPHFKFISYGLITITTPTTMRRITINQNTFFIDLAIAPINGILQKDELKFMEFFKRSTIFTAMESTRKSSTGDENLPYIRHMGDHLCHMVTFYLPYIVIW